MMDLKFGGLRSKVATSLLVMIAGCPSAEWAIGAATEVAEIQMSVQERVIHGVHLLSEQLNRYWFSGNSEAEKLSVRLLSRVPTSSLSQRLLLDVFGAPPSRRVASTGLLAIQRERPGPWYTGLFSYLVEGPSLSEMQGITIEQGVLEWGYSMNQFDSEALLFEFTQGAVKFRMLALYHAARDETLLLDYFNLGSVLRRMNERLSAIWLRPKFACKGSAQCVEDLRRMGPIYGKGGIPNPLYLMSPQIDGPIGEPRAMSQGSDSGFPIRAISDSCHLDHSSPPRQKEEKSSGDHPLHPLYSQQAQAGHHFLKGKGETQCWHDGQSMHLRASLSDLKCAEVLDANVPGGPGVVFATHQAFLVGATLATANSAAVVDMSSPGCGTISTSVSKMCRIFRAEALTRRLGLGLLWGILKLGVKQDYSVVADEAAGLIFDETAPELPKMDNLKDTLSINYEAECVFRPGPSSSDRGPDEVNENSMIEVDR